MFLIINPFKEEKSINCFWNYFCQLQSDLPKGTLLYPGFCGKEDSNPTWNWVNEIHTQYPHLEISLLMGDDSFENIYRWYESKKLLIALSRIIVVPRDEKIM